MDTTRATTNADGHGAPEARQGVLKRQMTASKRCCASG